MRQRYLLLPLLLGTMLTPCFGRAAEVRVESTTILRAFENDIATRFEDDKRVFGLHEFLRAEIGQLSGDGFSVHAYGTARYDFVDFRDDRSDAELFYGFLQYAQAANNVLVRAGRQHVFQGLAQEDFDGLRADTDLTPYFGVSLYGGQPLAIEIVNGRKGDSILGGRFFHRMLGLYELGVSYKNVKNDGDRERELMGFDVVVTPPGPVSIFGSSTRNLVTDDWAEHSYRVRASLGRFTLEPSVDFFDFDAYFDAGVYTRPPFAERRDIPASLPPALGSGEKLTVIGARASWLATKTVEIGAKVKHYDYEERDDQAWYYAALASARGPYASTFGAEVGRMDGVEEDERYWLLRAFGSAEAKPVFLFGDVAYATYDQEILGEDFSFSASLGVGTKLTKAFSVSLRGDYTSGPFFDSDLRGFLTLNYVFER